MGGRLTSAVATRRPPSAHPAADPFGFVPLFRWDSNTGPIVRPSLAALVDAGAPTTFDYDALSVFLRLGFFLGDDTPFASIRAVGAAQQPFSGPPLRLSRSQAVDAFVETFSGRGSPPPAARAGWRPSAR